MIFDFNSACEQVKRLLTEYPKLYISESATTQIRLSGSIEVYRTACGFTLQREYPVEITIPIGDERLPSVIDIDNIIRQDYPHRYADGSLCIETDTAIRMRFVDGFDLVAWMDEFVEPYFFSYEYYTRYEKFPFGERPHGLLGILDTYQDIVCATQENVATLLCYAAEEVYRGHLPCPCGSGNKLRNCHGQYLYPIMTNQRKKAIAQEDWQYLLKEISRAQSRRNHADPK